MDATVCWSLLKFIQQWLLTGLSQDHKNTKEDNNGDGLLWSIDYNVCREFCLDV